MADISPSRGVANLPPRLPDKPARLRRWSTPRTIMALVLREMSTRYGRSPGGYLWAVLEPIGAIIVMAVGFALLFQTPALGTDFLLFYATGYLPFSAYQSISNTTARAISFSRPLLAYPGVTWMDAILARFLLNVLTTFFVSFLILSGVIALSSTQTVLQIGTITAAMSLAALLGLGIGTMNCYLMLRIQVWDIAWSIISRPLFLGSGIFFLYEDTPPMVRDYLYYNPLVHIISLMRSGFYASYRGEFVSIGFVMAFAMVPMAFGLLLLRRHHKDLINDL